MKVPLDPPPWDGRDVVAACWEEAGRRRFALKGRTDIITAAVTPEDDLLLFPERSSGHRALVAAFGLA